METVAMKPHVPAQHGTAQKASVRPRDFDFLFGKWKVRNRRLKERLARPQRCTEWVEFDATSVARPLLDGFANEDEFRSDFWPGFVGMSFRFFNPQTKQWAIYWADSKRGTLEPPVVGAFSGDGCVCEGPDTFEGRAILVRYIWSRCSTPNPRWEQTFSEDGGKTWESNWIMEFTRDDA